MSFSSAWYGWRAGLPDFRDLVWTAFDQRPVANQVDLRHLLPPVMDQGPIGSCTANAVTAAARYHIIRRNTTYDFDMSRLQLYHDGRSLDGTETIDAGAQIRNVIKALAKNGVGHEELWPYSLSNVNFKPTSDVYDDAVQYKALRYSQVKVARQPIKLALTYGNPVIIGLSIYESFEGLFAEKTGMVAYPERGAEKLVGGHCMLVVGYGQQPDRFTVMNSWGTDWGDSGFCYIPEAYVANPELGADYWILDLFGSEAEEKAGTA